MSLQLSSFSEPVQTILADALNTPFPLVRVPEEHKQQSRRLAAAPVRELFPSARFPDEARSGLLLRLGCWEESHLVSQELTTAEGSYWHGIAHRLEPDYVNAGYWFRRVGSHAIFPQLRLAASGILAAQGISSWRLKEQWDPFIFNAWCDEVSRSRGSAEERAATLIQNVEWELLLTWCGSNLVVSPVK